MSTKFYVTSEDNPDKLFSRVNKNDAVTYSFDFRPWQEDNHTITSVTWTLEAGNASLGTPSTTSGVSTCLVTFSNAGKSLISVKATTSTEVKKVFLAVLAKDELLAATDDYGLVI